MEVVPVLADVTPLRVSANFRRLFLGLNLAQFGQQMTAVAVAIQVYDLTNSSLAVGTVGIVMLVPMVLGGLYGERSPTCSTGAGSPSSPRSAYGWRR